MRKLVYGVGINDADYPLVIKEQMGFYASGKIKYKVIWRCPFHQRWRDMLCRCYSQELHRREPTYVGCQTVSEWHLFSNFKAWMEKQDWEGKQLDKDLLVPGNKVYGPDTCVFVESRVNKFFIYSDERSGEYPVGVNFLKKTGNYKAYCCSVETGKGKHIGTFNTVKEAHEAYLTFKLEQAKILASQQTDERVAKAILERFN